MSDSVLVIGGGIAGVQAALDLAEAGVPAGAALVVVRVGASGSRSSSSISPSMVS